MKEIKNGNSNAETNCPTDTSMVFPAFAIGALLGLVVGYIWSNSQVHTLPSGILLRGEYRSMNVIGDALQGGFIGGIVFAVIEKLRHVLNKRVKNRSSTKRIN